MEVVRGHKAVHLQGGKGEEPFYFFKKVAVEKINSHCWVYQKDKRSKIRPKTKVNQESLAEGKQTKIQKLAKTKNVFLQNKQRANR